MDRKTLVPAVAVALLGCITLMLAVIGGLYAYNTFLADAPTVHAQSSDKGPDWTVSTIEVGSGTQLLVIVCDVDNPIEAGTKTKQMAVYELRGNNARVDLWFVGARTLAYDFKFPELGGKDATNSDKYSPAGMKKAAEAALKNKGK